MYELYSFFLFNKTMTNHFEVINLQNTICLVSVKLLNCFNFVRFKGHSMLAPFTAGWQTTDLHPLVIERSEVNFVAVFVIF